MYNTLPISNQKTKSFRVGLYIRLSREDGDKEESSSVTNQREILKRYVSEQENFFIVKEYVDDGWTGTNFDRPKFKEMIKDIEAGVIDTVITKDLSRLGRERLMLGYYTEMYFPEHSVRYIALLDNIDTYSYDDIEAKLSVICVRNKVSFDLDKPEEEKAVVFNLDHVDDTIDEALPAWVQRVQEVAKEKNI